MTAADEDTAIAVAVVPRQAGDAPLLEPMLDATLARVPALEEITGDKGFDGDAIREAWLDRGVNPNIPHKKNRVNFWRFDPVAYSQRNRVERFFAKLKQFRRAATWYEKRKTTYLGVLHLALGFIRLRKTVNDLNTASPGRVRVVTVIAITTGRGFGHRPAAIRQILKIR